METDSDLLCLHNFFILDSLFSGTHTSDDILNPLSLSRRDIYPDTITICASFPLET